TPRYHLGAPRRSRGRPHRFPSLTRRAPDDSGGVAHEAHDRLAGAVGAHALAVEHLPGHTLAPPDEPEEDVLGGDVVVAEPDRLPEGEFEHLLGPGRERGGAPGAL